MDLARSGRRSARGYYSRRRFSTVMVGGASATLDYAAQVRVTPALRTRERLSISSPSEARPWLISLMIH